ncbi:MAG TPA: Crp/Fnr family transcriptional regulator [Chitinophagaceae bacterium]|jgi:CRP-like cAMP-binding protein|nr:Crp/Fnr family transcriptional regulator [Chitinophagaceae bacterium]
MFEVLRAYFENSFPVTEESFALIKSILVPKTMTKGDILLREGEVAKYGAFVAKGMLRSYVIDNKGKEHIIQFAPENWWISDKTGLTDGSPSTFFIDAIEDSEILLIDMKGHLTLIEKLPGYAASFRTGIQKRTAAKDQRIVASLTETAKERYNDFLKTYPTIAQRVPQHMLASYLGITPETVSRIRKQASRKK